MVTGEERAETVAFIEAVMATPCMRYAHKYLASKGQAPESETGFKVEGVRQALQLLLLWLPSLEACGAFR